MRELIPQVKGSAETERGLRAKDPFFERLRENGCSILTNPHHIDTREQSLKDTWFGFYKIYCCKSGKTHDGKPLLDTSSGNFPLYFPDFRLSEIRQAQIDAIEDSGAYMYGIRQAREEVAEFYGVSPRHVFFCPGISDGIEMLHKVFLNNTRAKVLIPNESYPTHFSTATTFGGKDLIVTFERDPETGIPDLSRLTNGRNPFSEVGFSSFIPYDNPNPIVYTGDFFRNDKGTGVFDLNEAAFRKDGKLRLVAIDNIYETFSVPEKHLRPERLMELSDGRNILVFFTSLSKAFMEPNKKAGLMVVYIPPELNVYAEGSIIRDFASDFDRRLCPVSYPSVRALVAAHKLMAEDKGPAGPHPKLEMLRREAFRRFIGEDGRGGNQATMCAVPYIRPLHPNLKIESSGYNLFFVDSPKLPWKDPVYAKSVMARLSKVIEGIPDERDRLEAANAFEYYLKNKKVEELDPSDIFCLDLAMEKGVAYAPAGRFYKLGTAPDRVAFRAVMVADNALFDEQTKLLSEFLLGKLGG